MAVPDDLRTVLEQCLAEDATAENLEIYLPTVREIITNLLQGLRTKQSIYRRIVSDQRRASEQPGSSGGHERNESRSSRGERSARGHRSQLSRTVAEGDRPERDSVSRKTAHSSGRRRDPPAQTVIAQDEEAFVGGFTPGLPEQLQQLQQPTQPNNEGRSMAFPEPPARNHPHGHPTPNAIIPVDPYPEQPPDPPVETSPAVQSPPPSAVPAHVKRYSLVDKPASPPAVVVEPSSPHSDQYSGPSTPPPETPPQELLPAMANSLAALQRSDVLERRASKRFSTFNISKITGASAARERSQRGHPNRRSLAVSSALTPGELAVLTEIDDEDVQEPPLRDEGSRGRSKPRATTPEQGRTALAVPPPPPAFNTQENTLAIEQSTSDKVADPQATSSRIVVFLQLGREVKKATLEPNISFASLRVLFVDKFSYNPGQENFPAIYIRDPSSGVQYELEDTEEVKEKCLLSLNIERGY